MTFLRYTLNIITAILLSLIVVVFGPLFATKLWTLWVIAGALWAIWASMVIYRKIFTQTANS